MHDADANDVIDFWLGGASPGELADGETISRWWKKDPSFDGQIRARFGALHRAVADGKREHWLEDARGRLAYIIVLDQLSRNIHRDTPAMYAGDPAALRASERSLAAGDDAAEEVDAAGLRYMPLMHAEDLGCQDRCVALFAALRDRSTGAARERAANSLRFAEAHRDIVARFGRFPHRNAILGRPTTPEEVQFLEQPGSSF